MFENLTLGTWSVDFKKKNKHKQVVRSLRVDDVENSEYQSHKEVVRVYGDDPSERQNAEFICFAFNLQQKYDIGLFELVIDTLEESKRQIEYLSEKFTKTGTGESVLTQIESVLNKVKQNK